MVVIDGYQARNGSKTANATSITFENGKPALCRLVISGRRERVEINNDPVSRLLETADWPHFPVYITRQILPFWLSLM